MSDDQKLQLEGQVTVTPAQASDPPPPRRSRLDSLNGKTSLAVLAALVSSTFALIASCGTPLFMDYMKSQREIEQRDAQWARDDKVAEAAADAAAALLASSNDILDVSEETHKLVNSGYTKQLEGWLATARALRVNIVELLDAKRPTQKPSQETLDQLAAITAKIAELEKELADRAAEQTIGGP